jgi:hypothetical protein
MATDHTEDVNDEIVTESDSEVKASQRHNDETQDHNDDIDGDKCVGRQPRGCPPEWNKEPIIQALIAYLYHVRVGGCTSPSGSRKHWILMSKDLLSNFGIEIQPTVLKRQVLDHLSFICAFCVCVHVRMYVCVCLCLSVYAYVVRNI